jgi:5-deoxy-D-glucuronate isomerase
MKYTAETMLVRSKDTGKTGVFAEVSVAQAGWEWLNMAARRMNAGEKWQSNTGDNEYVHVIFGGKCNIRSSAGEFLNIGHRENVFAGKPYGFISRETQALKSKHSPMVLKWQAAGSKPRKIIQRNWSHRKPARLNYVAAIMLHVKSTAFYRRGLTANA